MEYRKMRLVENLILLMFPATLLLACTTPGSEQSITNDLASAEETLSIVQQESPIFYADESDLRFGKSLIEKVDAKQGLSWTIEETTDDKYIIVSPSMHLAVFKTNQDSQQVKNDNIQTANLKESYAINFPLKSTFRFESDTYNLSSDDMLLLQDHAEFLRDNPQFNLTVSGHTDRTGSAQYNQVLSEQRAQLVTDILVTYGAPASQIIAEGYGESVPVKSVDNLQENRRVELEYSRALIVSEM